MQAHSTDEPASLAAAVAVALESADLFLSHSLFLSLVLVRHFRFRCGAKQNQLQCTFCPTLACAGPLPYLPATASTMFRFAPLHAVPCQIPWPSPRLPGCLAGCLEMQNSTQCSRAANTTHKVIFILRPQVPLLLSRLGWRWRWS